MIADMQHELARGGVRALVLLYMYLARPPIEDMRLGLIMTLLGVGAAFVAPIAGISDIRANIRSDIRIRMGVQVKTLKPAPPGAPKPKAGDIVVAHYTGWLKQGLGKGDQFDSSRGGFGPFQKPPFTFALGRNRVIKAWDVGIAKMRIGETALLTCTSDVCYGRDGAGPIPPKADLIFEVELLGVEGYQPSLFEQQR